MQDGQRKAEPAEGRWEEAQSPSEEVERLTGFRQLPDTVTNTCNLTPHNTGYLSNPSDL